MIKLNPQKCALLMIDMQGGFINPQSSLCVAGAEASIDACASVLNVARASSMPVFHIRRQYSYDGSDVEPVRKNIWLKGGRPLCEQGEDPSSLLPPEKLAALDGEQIIIKPRFSAFFQTELDDILRDIEVDTVVLIGTTTPNCIRTTCYDALSLNYNVVIVEDATSSRTPAVQTANIEDMEFIGAYITDSAHFAELMIHTES